jgi:outer membrane protein TolC
VPVSLEAVFRLSQSANTALAHARARLATAFADHTLAVQRWLPEVKVGVGYYRHEGGIQDQDGRLLRSSTSALVGGLDVRAQYDPQAVVFAQLNAARKVAQAHGELRQLTQEQLLDATTLYIDLLAVGAGLAVLTQQDAEVRDWLERAQKLAAVEQAVEVEVARLQAALAGSQQVAAQLRQQQAAGLLKLAYHLGVDSAVPLVPVETEFPALTLLEPTAPVEPLVAQVLANGVGVAELTTVLHLLEAGQAYAEGRGRWLPTVEVQAHEGAFAAGPNGNLGLSNRFDVGVQARWNVTSLFTADQQRAVALARQQELHAQLCDVRAKLALAVRASQRDLVAGWQQLQLADATQRHADQAHALSARRLRNQVPGATYSEVLLALQAVTDARRQRVQLLRAYNQAQVRLAVLVGSVP